MLGGSMFRQFEDDPFFGEHMQGMQQAHNSMQQMMGGMMMNPFQQPGAFPAIADGRTRDYERRGERQRGVADRTVGLREPMMDPFRGAGMPNMFGNFNAMMGNMQNMMGSMEAQMTQGTSDPNAHFYSSSTVMSYDNTRGGQPRVYQASRSTRQGPGGIRETKKAMRDSEKGLARMEHGRHIGDRGHVMEREENLRSGDREDRQNFLNMDENEVEGFNSDWRTRAHPVFEGGRPGIEGGRHSLAAPRARDRDLDHESAGRRDRDQNVRRQKDGERHGQKSSKTIKFRS